MIPLLGIDVQLHITESGIGRFRFYTKQSEKIQPIRGFNRKILHRLWLTFYSQYPFVYPFPSDAFCKS